jgi:hypothetical protein
MILGERNKGEADVGRITAKERTCGWEGAEWTPRNVAAGGRGPQELVAHTAAGLLRWGGPAGQHTPHVKRPDPYPATSYSSAPPPALSHQSPLPHQPPSDIFCSNLFPDLYLILPIRVCLKAVACGHRRAAVCTQHVIANTSKTLPRFSLWLYDLQTILYTYDALATQLMGWKLSFRYI